MALDLSIILPCYNEGPNIPLIIERVGRFWPEERFELILVNNGSTDESAAILAAEISKPAGAFVRVVTVEHNIGYGHGILTGLKAARAPVLAYSHADIQTPPEDVFKAFHLLAECQLDVRRTLVKGKRVNRPKDARVLTNGLAKIAAIVLGQRLDDINGQPKLFSRTLLAKLRRPPAGFAFDTYLLYVSRLEGLALVDFPVDFGARLHGQSKWAFSLVSRYKTIWQYLVSILMMAIAHYDAPGNLLRQLARFIATGIFTNLVNYATFLILLRWLALHYIFSSVAGFLAGFAAGFWLNRRWTFEATAGASQRQLFRFLILNAISLAANVGAIHFFTAVVRLAPEISQLLAIALSSLINFTGSKFWVFRRAAL